MTIGKAYAVFLTDGVTEVMGKSFSMFIKSKDEDFYIYAKSIDPEGNYFQLAVDQEVNAGEKIEIELQIPHEFIKGVVCGSETDIKDLGILTP